MAPQRGAPARRARLAVLAPAAVAGLNATGALLDHLCEGHDEEWGSCPDLGTCDDCTPVDCRFSQWGEWYEGDGCIGLHFRHRSVRVPNNKCGKPCEGAKIESEVHLKPECRSRTQDCTFTEWGEWSACEDDLGQSTRAREVDRPPSLGGEPCAGGLEETRPCGGPDKQDCLFSGWGEWTECSATCGEGRHTRQRRIEVHAQHGGRTCGDVLLESRNCTIEECPSADCELSGWSEWSACDREHFQKIRNRQVKQSPQGKGEPCAKDLVETAGCDEPGKVDCEVADWAQWTECSSTCHGGQRQRERELARPNRNGGNCPLLALKEVGACGEEPCESGPPHDCEASPWSPWSDCLGDAAGSRTRSRTIEAFASPGAEGCDMPLQEVAPCPESGDAGKTDCAWGEWEQWTECTSSCGGGTKRRARDVKVQPQKGGKSCEALDKVEISSCNSQTCDEGCVDGLWGNWMQWTECSATCSRGYKSRRRTIDVQPNYCGKLLHGLREEFLVCDDLPPCEEDRDCKLSEWGSWSPCSCACSGTRERNRRIAEFASGNGKPCANATLKAVEPCNPGVGEEAPAECGSGTPQDCELGDWSEWSDCSLPCGGGQQERKRAIKAQPAHGGRPCADSLLATRPCHTQPCEAETCQDCTWGQWSDWGDCSKCGGQRWRHRSVETLPNHCGNACELTSAKEVSNCTSRCHDAMFCAWSEWSELSCPERCGESASLRSRTLSFHKEEPAEYLFVGTDSSTCIGSQLKSERCPLTEACTPDCQPRDCELGDWSDWNEPTCVGLCERQRAVRMANNECGEPCAGALMETKECEANCTAPKDCKLSAWADWTDCDVDRADQRYRRRQILQEPSDGGEPCVGALEETGGCGGNGTEDCELSKWGDWSECSSSCGNGTTVRKRELVHQARGGGKQCSGNLEELSPCRGSAEGCPASGIDCAFDDWEDWSPCEASGQRDRVRSVAQPMKAGGIPCLGALRETESCKDRPVDCEVSDWTEWEACSQTCGVGQTQRQRQVHRFPENGGELCPSELTETKGCNEAPCDTQDCVVSGWVEWGACSTTCGPGHQSRMRAVTQLRGPGGAGCFFSLGMTRACDGNLPCNITDCAWGDWEDWGDCSASCGGGTKKRSRDILEMPTPGGKPCEARPREEIGACGTEKCQGNCVDGAWEDWQAWTPCSVSCDGGTRFRKRRIARMANSCGKEPQGRDRETEFCNTDVSCEASRDCELGEWEDWGDCSASCSGTMERARRVRTYGRGDGAFCSGALRELRPCNPGEDEVVSEGCVVVPPTDCKLGPWQEWGECSATCGGGQHVRTREVEQHPVNGGKACDDPLTEISECGRAKCAASQGDPVDCAFGDWQDWGACTKCSGERTRFRDIVTFAENGGKPCEQFDAGEVGTCPRKCDREAFCSWDSWSEWGPCTASCGTGGKRRRQRLLRLVEGGEQDDAEDAPQQHTATGPLLPEVMGKYELLFRRTKDLEEGHVQEVAAAYVCGCLALVAAAGLFRGAQRLAAPRDRDAAWRPRGEPPQELPETRRPLVGGPQGCAE